jgi:uncharacterized protein
VSATSWVSLAIGGAFGFFLTASGLGDYRTIHEGLMLRDPYIYLMMLATVATAWGGIRLLKHKGETVLGGPLALPHHPPRRSTVYGASMFGVAFGIGATCPGITVAMIATGGLWGASVLVGVFAGLWLRGVVEAA